MHLSVLLRLRFATAFLVALLMMGFTIAAIAQSQTPESASNTKLANINTGSVSGNEYRNDQLGFSYQFPKGWTVNDDAAQKRMISANRQFAWADDIAVTKDKKKHEQCSKNLLFVTKYPVEMQTSDFNPTILMIVADPSCTANVSFPKSTKDADAIQRVSGQVGLFFRTADVTVRRPARIRAFDDDGRVIIEVSQEFGSTFHEPGRITYRTISSSTIIAQSGNYWVMWMFLGSNDTELSKLRATKIFFDSSHTTSKPE